LRVDAGRAMSIRLRSDGGGVKATSTPLPAQGRGNLAGNPDATTRPYGTALDEIGPVPEQPRWFWMGPVGRFRSDSYRKVEGSSVTVGPESRWVARHWPLAVWENAAPGPLHGFRYAGQASCTGTPLPCTDPEERVSRR